MGFRGHGSAISLGNGILAQDGGDVAMPPEEVFPPPVTAPGPVDPPLSGTGFYPSVLLLADTSAGFARIGDSGGASWAASFYSGFGSACAEPTDAGTRLLQVTGVPKLLVAATAPADLDIHDTGCTGASSRLRDGDAVVEFAARVIEVCSHDADIKAVTFWAELKGYYTEVLNPGNWDVDAYVADYEMFADLIRDARPDLLLGGPYSAGFDGQNEDPVYALDDRVKFVHDGFITFIGDRPDLVDFIAWDHGDGTKFDSYTRLYADAGITLPHYDMEWFPPDNPGAIARIACDMACDPMMFATFMWGSGTDAFHYVPLWDAFGNPTANWLAMTAVARFTARGGVTRVSADHYANAAGQTCVISGNTVTVA